MLESAPQNTAIANDQKEKEDEHVREAKEPKAIEDGEHEPRTKASIERRLNGADSKEEASLNKSPPNSNTRKMLDSALQNKAIDNDQKEQEDANEREKNSTNIRR